MNPKEIAVTPAASAATTIEQGLVTVRTLDKREALRRIGGGIGMIGFAHAAAAASSSPLAPKPPHFPAKAKRVICLFQSGGPSHLDLLDDWNTRMNLTAIRARPAQITRHLLDGVRFIPSPNADERPDPADISLIVIHCISLPPGEFGGAGGMKGGDRQDGGGDISGERVAPPACRAQGCSAMPSSAILWTSSRLRMALPWPWKASMSSAARASFIGTPLRASAKLTIQRTASEACRSAGTSSGT